MKRIWYLLIISPAFLEAFCGDICQKTRRRVQGEDGQTHIHGVAAGGDLAGVALGQSPEEGVGKGVLAEVGQQLVINLEGGEVG